MASGWYDKGLEAFASATINYPTDTIRVSLVDTTYTFNAATQFYSSITNYGASTPQTLASKTVTNGYLDAADVVFASLATTGTPVKGLVMHKWTGVAGTSPLLVWIEFPSPVTPNGTNLTVAFASGPPPYIARL